MKRTLSLLYVALLLVPTARLFAGEPEGSGRPKPALRLDRGICIDRQLRSIPPGPGMRVCRDDLRLIKRMGFEFVKLLFNPAVFQSADGIDSSHVGYLDQLLDSAAAEKLPVVACIHPEDDFKRRVLGNAADFERFFGFMQALSRHIAGRWTPGQVAFQLMTEPYGTSPNPADWNHWNRLQRRLWRAVRGQMPGHTLILSGDRIGSIEGLDNIQPVEDENAMYCFTFYEPHLFTFQGGTWRSDILPGLGNLPYPSSGKLLAELPRYLESVPEPSRAAAARQIDEYARERWDRSRLAARIDKAVGWRRRHGGRPKLWCAEFGCYQAAVSPADRCRYLLDMRTVLEERGIGWAYWSYSETFSVMTSGRPPFGPASAQTPDKAVLKVLLPDK